MKPNRVVKQPSEEFKVGADFAPDLAEGDQIAAWSLAIADKAGAEAASLVLVAGSLSREGSRIVARVQGGTRAESPYNLSFRCQTLAGDRYEIDVRLYVVERR